MDGKQNRYEFGDPTCIFVSMRHKRFPLWAIAEEIADATNKPYEDCLKFVRKAEELPRGLPLPEDMIEYYKEYKSARKK